MRDVVANFIRDIQPIKPLLVGARAPEWYLVRRSGLVINTPRSRHAHPAKGPRPSTRIGGPTK